MKVLIVDDEPTVRKLLERSLREHGYLITVAGNGAEGVAAARAVGPDLIITDVSMPVMDGYELVRTVRADPAIASIPIILLSAHRASDDMVEGYRSGADDYISKPVDFEVLRHKINALVRRAQPRTEVAEVVPTAGRLICVTSAKGGAGVTTVAANLAVVLGGSMTDQKVCAVDLDLAHGDLQVLLDLHPPGGLAEAVREVAGDGVHWDDHLVRHEGGPWLLAAPRTPLDASELTDAAISQVLASLRTSQDLVVADVPPSYGELTVGVYEAADRVVVVVSPEITALRRTRELLNVLESLHAGEDRVLLVLNTIFEKSLIDRARVAAFLRRPVSVVIPFGGRAFLEAVNGGRPVVAAYKGKAVDALVELAGLLHQED